MEMKTDMCPTDNITKYLVCPGCKSEVTFSDESSELICNQCSNKYPVHDGIFHLISGNNSDQAEEITVRDNVAEKYIAASKNAKLVEISRHHCIPVMEERARLFREKCNANGIILDIGGGWGWHWINTTGPMVIIIDFSLQNLRIAKSLLNKKANVQLVWADAANLPVKNSIISGIWSIQTTQHFPEAVMNSF